MSLKILNRPLAIFLLTAFSLTQSIPAGWSADLAATNEQGIQQPVVPISEAVTPAEEAKSINPPLPALGDEMPLSLPEKDIPSVFFEMPRPGDGPKEEPEEKEGGVKELIRADLVNSFGLSEKNIESWMKEGLIKIEVSRDKGTATVYIDPSIQHGSFVNQGGVLVDPLGLKEIPKEIKYQLAEGMQLGMPCFIDDCPEPALQIASATFYGNGFDNYVLNYLDEGEPPLGKTRLRSVSVYRSDPRMLCGEPPCGTIVKELSFRYEEKGGIQVTVRYPESGKPEIGKETPVSQEIFLEEMEDGQYHIKTVEEYDQAGKLLVKNQFEYEVSPVLMFCPEGADCRPSVNLISITRTDSEGNPLSTIDRFQRDLIRWKKDPLDDMPIGDGPFMGATVTLTDGTVKQVTFNTLEGLFEEVRKLEARGPEIPAIIQEFVDQLRGLLSYRVDVEASDVPGRYRIRILPPDGSIRPLDGMPSVILPGQLHSMSFEVTLSPKTFPMAIGDSPVKVLPKYFEVRYEGMPEVDGAMLYEGMLQLAEPGPQGLPNPIAAIHLMTRIHLTGASENLIRFRYEDQNWRVLKNSQGEAILVNEEEAVKRAEKVARDILDRNFDFNGDGILNMEDRKIADEAVISAVQVADLLEPELREIYNTLPDGQLNEKDIDFFRSRIAHVTSAIVWAGLLQEGNYDKVKDGVFDEADSRSAVGQLQNSVSSSYVKDWLTEEQRKLFDFNGDGDITHNDLPELQRRYEILIEAQSLLPGARAGEMRVVSAEPNGPIVFEYQAQRWILYRDASGKVRLEREIPPAVRAFVDQLRGLLSYRVEVEPSEVPGRYQIRIFPPDGSVRPLDRMPALILPGQLHSMSFEVALRPETFPISIGESPVEVLPKYFEVRYEGMPEVDGAMLYEGMLQLAEPGPQGLPNPIAAIHLMAKIQISQVDSDGTLHFSYREESWRIYRDQSGKVVLEKEPVEREIKLTLREQMLLKRLGKVIAFEKLTATPKNKSIATLHYQFNATGPGTAELTFTIDPCGGNPLCLAPVFRATLIVDVRVSFLKFALKKTQEVDLKPGKQQITLNLGDGLRINLPGTLKAGNLIGATERRFPSKPPVIVPLPKPKPPVAITPLPKSKLAAPTDSKKKKKNRRYEI